jgi:lysozyme
MMQVSAEGLEILKEREALRLTAYKDSAGVWTIGYGATYYESGARVKQGDVITAARALQLLSFHVGVAASEVNSLISVNLNAGQFDALTSFAYNVGGSNFAKSTLRTLVNTNPNDFERIKAAFMSWVYVTVNGVKVRSKGLENRRKEEIEMYVSGTSKKKSQLFWIAAAVVILILYRKYA